MQHDLFHKNIPAEGICNKCGQLVKFYKRMIHSSMACALIKFYKMQKIRSSDFINLIELAKAYPYLAAVSRGGDFAKMSYWGLVEEALKDPNDTTKRTSGLWSITSKGIDFIESNIKIPKYCIVYNKTIYGFDNSKLVDIVDCLGKKFNYAELMSL